MKFKFTIFAILSVVFSFGQTNEKITIPKGVVYKYCDNTIVEKAKQMIHDDLDNDQYSLSQKILIVGPVLWERFGKIKTLHEIEGGNTTFHVDDKELKGKMTQDEKDTQKVWSELRKEVKGKNYSIRKLTPDELRYYWSVISFDIEEPLLIVETDSHSYILNILKDDLKIMWLDEVPRP